MSHIAHIEQNQRLHAGTTIPALLCPCLGYRVSMSSSQVLNEKILGGDQVT
jgi:hypothetical protein